MSVPRVQSLSRATALLEAIRRRPRGASTATLARDVGLAPATAGRLLATLADAGFVARGADGWVLGDALVRLAQHADPYSALARRVRPVLARLAAEGRESAMLAVPRPGPDVRVVAQVDGPWLLGLTNWVGRPVQLHASAAGKLVLAELDDKTLERRLRTLPLPRLTARTVVDPQALRAELRVVRERGWATLEEESEEGLSSVAMAVRDADGTLGGLVGFSGPSHRFDAAPELAGGQVGAGAAGGSPPPGASRGSASPRTTRR